MGGDDLYYQKYIKYKTKYFNLKTSKNTQLGGKNSNINNTQQEIFLFKAKWCGHCTGFAPTWDKISKDLNSKYSFITMDAEEDKDKISAWNIRGYPTIIKRSGKNATEYVGSRDEQSVREFIESN
jgi:thiol-disulfide isomerase/thioredoxin